MPPRRIDVGIEVGLRPTVALGLAPRRVRRSRGAARRADRRPRRSRSPRGQVASGEVDHAGQEVGRLALPGRSRRLLLRASAASCFKSQITAACKRGEVARSPQRTVATSRAGGPATVSLQEEVSAPTARLWRAMTLGIRTRGPTRYVEARDLAVVLAVDDRARAARRPVASRIISRHGLIEDVRGPSSPRRAPSGGCCGRCSTALGRADDRVHHARLVRPCRRSGTRCRG